MKNTMILQWLTVKFSSTFYKYDQNQKFYVFTSLKQFFFFEFSILVLNVFENSSIIS